MQYSSVNLKSKFADLCKQLTKKKYMSYCVTHKFSNIYYKYFVDEECNVMFKC